MSGPPASPASTSPEGRSTGLRAFTAVALGQFFSLLGTGMTGVALTYWVWKSTGSATALALVWFFTFAPTVVLSPMAGALVDRWNRKTVMMLADIAAGVGTVALLTLYLLGRLDVWHLYALGLLTGAFQAFQFPAYSAAITLMVPKEHYSRASALISLAQGVAGIFAPVAAGALVGFIGFAGIMIIDLVSLAIALGILLWVHVPQPPVSAAGREARGSLLNESAYGFRYVLARPSLLGLQLIFFFGNLLSTLCFTLGAPMVLARTGNNPLALGAVQTAAAAGAVVGGLLLTAWSGPRRKIHGVLLGWAGSFLAGEFLMGLGRTVPVWAVAIFAGSTFGALVNASNQAIWQRKVPPDIQGRVFSARLLIAQISGPVATLIAGPLADRVLEPGMREGGRLAGIFGGLLGVGPGTGISLLFLVAGVTGAVMALIAYAIKPIRDVERIIPDFDDEPGDVDQGQVAGGTSP
jgi:DHA3 family macrolide efflux protein-like MFS transporter